ncbi:biotin carboxyl carrier protein [Scopulibacillus daqui]|uniref:Biotin carboxyl carrier protein n=1 Tax=Scopulibacillus daqui TaxID=1469162 RepID=A0ABS2Q4C2_9BACL|nr:hypothetical protein [Scopulibacillus daqui]MBM7646971.1 biotin carboxyl carrier protein [Scopulibacillus daqui]
MRALAQPIYSPCHGKVENIFINESAYVYEWEKLFLIRNNRGFLEEIAVGMSGLITSLEVKPNQEVTPDTVMAKVKEDLFISGSD